MSEKTIRLGAIAFAVIVTVGAGVTYSFAQDHEGERGEKWREHSERHEAVKAAFETGDYTSFVEALPEDHPKLEVVTEENFGQLQEAHQLMKDGDRAGAKAIFEELGIEKKFHGKKYGKKRLHKGNPEVRAAIEAGDYAAFVEAVPAESPRAERITEENFSQVVEAHRLMREGDKEGAKAIFDELGFERPERGKHFRKGGESQ